MSSSSTFSLVNLFYPRLCAGCSKSLFAGEELMCIGCKLDMPYTRTHDHAFNSIELRLTGRFEFVAATSLLYFVKNGKVQHMLHQLKYHGDIELGHWMGRSLADELMASERFAEIDFVVSVPLHPRKEKARGYNQCDIIGTGMEERGLTFLPKVLRRVADSESQTSKNLSERWENVAHIFALNSGDQLRGRKVLLIDDVLTTGATLEACAKELLRIDGIELYIATIACAEN